MRIEVVKIEKLNPAAYNPRKALKPGDPEYDRLKKSILEFDYIDPIIWNERSGYVVGGHQRLAVLKEIGAKELAVSVVDLDDAKEKALNIALNKISGEWDLAKLKDLLEELDTGDFDMEVTGFDASEIEDLMTQFHQPEDGLTEDDAIPEDVETRCKEGDLWQLGEHRLLCGDATKKEDVERLMDGKKAVLMNTDPPYGVNYGDIQNSRLRAADKKKGKPPTDYQQGKERAIKNDDLDGIALQSFLEEMICAALPHITANAAYYLWHPMLTQGTFFAAAAAAADILIHRQIIWVKPSLIMGRGDYHWRHELCFYGWVRGNRPQWLKGRNQDTVWEVGRENDHIHPTQKPIELFIRPIDNHTHVGDICYEPFGGSGSQFIACEKTSRICCGMEIDPHYCDVIIQRWEDFTGKKAALIND